jgi:cyanate permease
MALGVPFISSVANLAGFLTPWLTGYVRDVSGSYTSGFVTAAVVQSLAAIVLIAGVPIAARRRNMRAATRGHEPA